MDAKNILLSLDLKSIPCEYCDVRLEETSKSSVSIQNKELITALAQSSQGAFLRVRKNGQWYYSSTTDLTSLQEQLLTLAQSPTVAEGTSWSIYPEDQGTFEKVSYASKNPTLVPLKEKVAMMEDYCQLVDTNPKIKTHGIHYKDIYKLKTYLNSVGTFFQYDFTQAGFTFVVNLADGEKTYSDAYRAYGEQFDQLKNQHAAIEKYLEEATQFIHAPHIPPGKYKVVLSSEVTGVFVHESFGHNSEADGMIGDPKAKEIYAIGKRVAPDFISIVDSGLHQGGSGYCPIDDEGFKATKTYLIKDGLLSGRLHSYDTALAMDEKPTGNGRALDFEFEPIVRMTSTYIENGTESREDLFKKAEGGLYAVDLKYGTGGELFTIAPGRAFLIKDGKPSIPVKVNVISGQLFETLLNIEAASNDFELNHSALGGCGKMEQMPLPVSDGGPTILVNGMQVS